MKWFFLVFFGVIALCAAIWLVGVLRSRFSPKTEREAVVTKRYSENFPMTMGIVKRDRTERHLFFETEDGVYDLSVGEDLYKLCPAGIKGRLTFQGERLLRFDVTAFSENIDG